MTSSELRKEFLNFFEKRAHKIVPSSSLVPADPSVLLTSAGMQQFVLYLTGEKNPIQDFGIRHLASCQKCFRTLDINEVGDDVHHTFFEMLGNWSIGQDPKAGYFKKGAIKYALEFFGDRLKLDKNRFWITIFKGEKGIPRDEESIKIWKENGISEERIKEFGLEDNLWGPVGESGPCGPTSEIHYDRGEIYGCGKEGCGPNCPNCNRFVELWNLVFMEYLKTEKGEYRLLSQKNVDTGIGFERLVAVLQKKDSGYETDLFWPIIQEIEKSSNKKYKEERKNFRVIADHIRGAVFLISEEIFPSNIERGYILRRILRRAIRYRKLLNLPKNFLLSLAQKVIEIYKDIYPEIKSKEADILTVIQKEEEKFEKTLEQGLKEFNKWFKKPVMYWGEPSEDLERRIEKAPKRIPGFIVFRLVTTYGFPIELIKEIAKEKELQIDEKGFEMEMKKHQEISRAGVEKKFGGVGKEATYEAAKFHTATHLLHAALREVLGEQVKQMGSDITPRRLRFDFSHPQKMTDKEIKKVEEIVNQKIKEDLEVKKEEMAYEKAIEQGALAFFKEKYPEKVTVFTIGDFSKEICAGPHAKRTSEIGQLKITKEESSGAGIRRIRAILVQYHYAKENI